MAENMFTTDPSQSPFDKNWPQMHPIILKLLEQKPVTKTEWRDLFWSMHCVCLWEKNGAEKILDCFREDVLNFVRKVQTRILVHEDDQTLLKAYTAEWNSYYFLCDYLLTPFNQLEAVLADEKKCKGSITKVMQDTWNEIIFSPIKDRLQSGLISLINAERNGEVFDSQLIIDIRMSYVNLCSDVSDKLEIYREHFEKAYLEAAETFYVSKAPEYLEANSLESYLSFANAKLAEEEHRAEMYLESQSSLMDSLKELCCDILASTVKEVALTECPSMIKNNQTKQLQSMFKLMDHVPDGVTPMLKDLVQHIIAEGLADMEAFADTIDENSEKYVDQLLKFFARFNMLVKEAFLDDPRFLASRDKAFREVVKNVSIFSLELPTVEMGFSRLELSDNTELESRCPQLLATYCDMLLRKTRFSKKLTFDEIEGQLKQVIQALKYIQNKDVFVRYYKEYTMSRFMLNSSKDIDLEKNMFPWFGDFDCVKELSVAKDFNQLFKDAHHNKTIPDFNAYILDAGLNLGVGKTVHVSLPSELKDSLSEVERFYFARSNRHKFRKLQWCNHMTTGTITFSNSSGNFDLNVTTFQMAVLLVWNQRTNDRITFRDLQVVTELSDDELRKTLWSLVASPRLKKQVLLLEPDVVSAKNFEDCTTFWVNQEFSIVKNGKSQKWGTINLIGGLRISTEKDKNICENIVQLRVHRSLDAISQIMKMRKKMPRLQLEMELVQVLKDTFLPSKTMIKELITCLVQQKFMMDGYNRDDDLIWKQFCDNIFGNYSGVIR